MERERGFGRLLEEVVVVAAPAVDTMGRRFRVLWPFTVVISSGFSPGEEEEEELALCSEEITFEASIAHVLCQSARVPVTAPFLPKMEHRIVS